jgi:hypothetical protein
METSPFKSIPMIRLELTPQETIILYGFMQGMIEKVNASPELELIDRENTTALIESIMYKVATELENQSNNN